MAQGFAFRELIGLDPGTGTIQILLGIPTEEILKLGLWSLFIKVPVSLIEHRTRIISGVSGIRPGDQSTPSCRVIVGGKNVAMTTETLVTEPNRTCSVSQDQPHQTVYKHVYGKPG